MAPPAPRSIVVIGANKGIGYEAVKLLAPKLPECTIYLTARSQENGQGAVKKMKESVADHSFANVRILILDVLDTATIEQAVTTVQKECGTLDVLLHNSGISNVGGDGAAKQVFDVNVQAVKACVDAFRPIVTPETGKIVVVSSEVGAWATHSMKPELQSKLLDIKNTTWERVNAWIDDWLRYKQGESGVQEPWPPIERTGQGYPMSKAFLNAYLRHYAQEHPDVKLAIVCPGYCATDLNFHQGHRPASEGGASICWPIFNEFQSGHFYQDGKEMPFVLPPPAWL